MLSPYRVLDLTNERGLLAGKMFADLGAEVIQVEPRGGLTARLVAPFFEDEAVLAERSIYWAAYACNKRGITCDISQPEGQELLRRLAATADFLFESDPPGHMDSYGLGYDDLAAVNPALIYASISPFGQDGSKAQYADSDLTLWAAGGPLGTAREADRPPFRVSVPQSYLHAAADAAGGALIAHFERIRSGRGQHVDVSAQQSVAQATLSGILAVAIGQFTPPQPPQAAAGLTTKWIVKDGYVELPLGMGGGFGHFTNNLMRWMLREGACDEAAAARDWRVMADLLARGEVTTEEYLRIRGLVGDFLRTRSKQELLEAAVEYKLLLSPVQSVADLGQSPQLEARGFWRTVDGDARPGLRYPGAFATISGYDFRYRRPAPTLGEHNHAVYVDELQLSEHEYACLLGLRVI